MGVPRPRREAQDLPDTSAPPPNETPDVDIRELPRNEAPRQGVVGDPIGERGRRTPGIEDAGEEPSPVRGPAADAGTGRAVTESETVADDEADADATDRNPARRDDPDAT